ncbi:MAG TPA: PEP/pyruvate-binding domain-containing protein [Nitrospiraceae bacterium]|nr:PEP/pyruvate-binding domain-containing protein [Nitrospiraceae bacterium]
MIEPFILPLEACEDPRLVGGKAAGLGRLLRHGFRVPPGFCLTTAAYRQALRELGMEPDQLWEQVRTVEESSRDVRLETHRRQLSTFPGEKILQWISESGLPQLERTLEHGSDTLWAVRSSASCEDTSTVTFAGVYRTTLGVSRGAMASAILGCWASVWTPAAWSYHARSALGPTPPAMAVVLQPMLVPQASGVAYSCHPLTGHSDVVAVNSVYGLAEPLVSGEVTPDSFTVLAGIQSKRVTVLERRIAKKTTRRIVTAAGIIDQPVALDQRDAPSVSDRHLVILVKLAKRVEQTLSMPVDLEWALDRRHMWLLQARPISATPSSQGLPLSIASCVWSRANFKETFPDLPSPLGLSLLEAFMEANIMHHYRHLGCHVPEGLPSLRVIRGRPYINLTLYQSFAKQLAGDPARVPEQMGGHASLALGGPPRLAWWALLRAGLRMEGKIRRAVRRAPGWFAEMKHVDPRLTDYALDEPSPADLMAHLEKIGKRLSACDITFAIVGGVAQGFHVLRHLLERRIGPEWRALLNTALQGTGTVISAKQILWLMDLAEQASREPVARDFLRAEPWDPAPFRRLLAGTRFLDSFDEYMSEYGHRAIGESDPMSPRYAETPEYVLSVIRGYLTASEARSREAIRREQESGRHGALQRIRAAFGWRLHERWGFEWWYRRLCRWLALRESNRHHMMHVSYAVRRLALSLGESLAASGKLQAQDDVFFLTVDELGTIVMDPARNGHALVAARRAERSQYATEPGPETVIGLDNAVFPRDAAGKDNLWRGVAVSAGYAEGPARLLRSSEDARQVRRGEVLVTAVIDPGLAPVLGLASGLVAEMGGTLSHGAIIAREYGIPTVVNVDGITQWIQDGEWIAVDAQRGEIRRLPPRGTD